MTWRAAERELVITRVFDAPRDLVWKAWTDRDRAQQWWGPRDFTVPSSRLTPERFAFTLIWDDEGPDSERR